MKYIQEQHFDDIAREYDYWKKKNYYYYDGLTKLFRSLIPRGSSVLEIGCGTGTLLSRLEPNPGLGTDISEEMIKIAKGRYASSSNMRFERENIYDSVEPFGAKYIFLADVLEHVDDATRFVGHMAKRVRPESKVIISLANPLWEPILLIAERLKMKMPEGPHKRLSKRETEKLFENLGFHIEEGGYRLLVPKKVLGGDWVNERFYKIPFLKKFGFVIYWVLRKR